MNLSSHPEPESLLAYGENPDGTGQEEISRHLAHCQQCRNQLARLTLLTRDIRRMVPAANPFPDEVDVFEVARYVNSEDGKRMAENFDTHSEQGKNFLKAALRYSLHSSLMEAGINTEESRSRLDTRNFATGTGATTGQDMSEPGLIKAWKKFFSWNAPAWVVVPVTAVLIVIISMTMPQNRANHVAVYQNNSVLHFQKTTQRIPGIGFFNAARESEIKYGTVSAQKDNLGRLVMQWPAVKNAKKYSVSIFSLDGMEKIILGEKETVTTTAAFQDLKLRNNHNYHWEIKGTTTDKQIFYTEGGLVVIQ